MFQILLDNGIRLLTGFLLGLRPFKTQSEAEWDDANSSWVGGLGRLGRQGLTAGALSGPGSLQFPVSKGGIHSERDLTLGDQGKMCSRDVFDSRSSGQTRNKASRCLK